MPCGDLDVPQIHACIEHGRGERMAKYMRVRPGDPHTSIPGQVPQAARGRVAVHPGAAAVEQDRAVGAGADGAVDSPPDGRWERDETILVPLPHTRSTRWPCSSPRSAPVASKIRRPSSPSIATSAKSYGVAGLVKSSLSWDIKEVDMTDMLIRDVPDDVIAALDAHAGRLGLSRSEYVRRRLAQDAAASSSPVSVTDLARFAEVFGDLADPDVMSRAWQ